MGKLDNVWKSNLPRETKINFFRATDESILLYGSETWTTTEKMIEHLDGTYTRLLQHTLNINWSQHITNEELYGNLPKISKVLKVRRLRFAGHCWRSNETAAQLLLWKPKHGQKQPGRPKMDFATLLSKDSGLSIKEMKTAMNNRVYWRTFIKDSGAPD